MRFGGDVGGALHQFNFFRSLEHAHLVHDGGRIDDGLRRMDRFSIEGAHPGNLPDDRIVEIGIDAEAVIELLCAVKNVLQLFVKLENR